MKAFDYEPVYKKTTLDNGVRIISEHHKYTRATSVGFFVDIGTRDEPENMIGAAHFLEHLLFKGTKTRTAYEIVKEIDAVGGELNAYTTKENTCFHAGTLREHQHIAIDVLADLLANANIASEEVVRERQVIEQEIDMTADLLEEFIFDEYFEKAYKGHPLDRPILGTKDTLKAISRDQIFDFYKQSYCGSELLVALAGDVDHDKAVEQIDKLLGSTKFTYDKKPRTKPVINSFEDKIKKDSEQAHILMGLPSSTYTDKLRFEAYIVNAILGGSMTSKLYQKVREEKGLAYSIYSYLQSFVDSGLQLFYAGCYEENIDEVMTYIRQEIDHIFQSGITQQELEFYKTQVVGTIILGADDIDNRMSSIAMNETLFGEYKDLNSMLEEIQSISTTSVKDYLHKYVDYNSLGSLILH